MTTFEYLRERLHARAELLPPKPPKYTYKQLAESEWSPRFEQLMRNRLIMGALRYGLIHAPVKRKYCRIKGALKRLNQYQESGNLECLVDVANMMLLEFEVPHHPLAHWEDIQGDHCG
jgi:hypothetical protein